MASLRVIWYELTDTVVITRDKAGKEAEELCEIPRADWQHLVDAIRTGDVKMPWEAPA
jgi:hypothetical protein